MIETKGTVSNFKEISSEEILSVALLIKRDLKNQEKRP